MVCELWMLNLARRGSEQLLLDNLIPRYVCRLFPEATNLGDVEIITKFIAWLTFTDNIVDNGRALILHTTIGYGFMGPHDHSPPSTTTIIECDRFFLNSPHPTIL